MKTIIILLALLLGVNVAAQEKKGKSVPYNFAVNGNCDMCKKRIERAAISVNGVKLAQWDADNLTLHLIINETKTSALEVKKAVAAVGHDTDEIKATDEAYNKLHGCCKYERRSLINDK